MRPRRASVTSPSSSIFSSFSFIPLRSVEGWAAIRRPRPSFLDLRDRGHVGRLGTLRALAGLERHPGALDERLEALAGDVAVVDEQVLCAFIRGDEAVALAVVEPLDGSVSHKKTPPSTLTNGWEGVENANRTRSNVGQR